MRRSGFVPAAIAAAALAATVFLAGCQDIVNDIFDTGAPTGLSASDGDYADSVEVSWSAPSLTSDKWKGKSITHYRVAWTGPSSGSKTTNSTSCSIPVSIDNRATYYEVTVTTVISWVDEGSTSDKGFAMDSETLFWPDGGKDYAMTGASRWYVTMLQEGFAYRFDFGASSGNVAFYPYKSLDLIDTGTASAPPSSTVDWKCDEGGNGHKFYVHVTPVAAGSGFRARCDLGFGF